MTSFDVMNFAFWMRIWVDEVEVADDFLKPIFCASFICVAVVRWQEKWSLPSVFVFDDDVVDDDDDVQRTMNTILTTTTTIFMIFFVFVCVVEKKKNREGRRTQASKKKLSQIHTHTLGFLSYIWRWAAIEGLEEEEEVDTEGEEEEVEEEGEDKSFVRFWKERESPSINNSRNFAQTSSAMRLFSPRIYPITIER